MSSVWNLYLLSPSSQNYQRRLWMAPTVNFSIHYAYWNFLKLESTSFWEKYKYYVRIYKLHSYSTGKLWLKTGIRSQWNKPTFCNSFFRIVKWGFWKMGKVPHSHYKIHRCLWPRSSRWLVELCVKTKNLKVNSKDSNRNAKIPQYLDISSVLPQKELFILKAKVFRLDSYTFFAGLSRNWVHSRILYIQMA